MSVDTKAELVESVRAILRGAQAAKRRMATAPTRGKNEALSHMADAIWARRSEILAANAADVDAARREGQPAARVDRLMLDEARLQQIIEGVREVEALPDPVGEEVERILRPNGLDIRKVRVPMGVIAMIYEARPNVTVDAAALAVKTGNVAVLRGGSEALRSNQALVAAIHDGLRQAGLPEAAVSLVAHADRDAVDVLIRARGYVDLAIPRGGAGLIRRVVENASVPVIETGVGNCHVYVDRAANFEMATRIVVNAKTQRPSVCNAAETLLVHAEIADAWLPDAARALVDRGVALRACPRALEILRCAGIPAEAAQEADWETEYLDLILAVRVVDTLEDAIAHIDRYGTQHSEVIVTEDEGAAREFLASIDAAAVYHNASSRFTDGFEFGFGAEIGISTQKMHARGPMGLRELTSYKYVVCGHGQVRE
ncbi:MAG: glutamate-5-semialdehyde dehydrogenase [Alicyclobacillus mali]|uniref:glutamate-5-semialdehyde dehydrogenase n=1 Tax=Alicyclobacillus mali (ex Roth et al. 2021) TaxID=1123961 RepID=UPI0023F46152|nr:glutamate-5-semialdehyde dehydrogenase [Alicyclobacillus mali (ex Roth et al. 2021)]MCL6489189.1 glutamate-5-semialdehyde dehydrogenase [Alicyclobacillus mali (ex Roth et al. 2021)]